MTVSKKSKKSNKAKKAGRASKSRRRNEDVGQRVSTQSRRFRKAGEAVLGAMLGQDVDLSVTWTHFEHVLNYELWLALKDDDAGVDAPTDDDLPSWYIAAARHSTDAFEFVRHHSFLYLGSALRQTPTGEMIVSLFRRAAEMDPSGADALHDTLDEAYKRFLRQYREAMASMRATADLSGPTAQLRFALLAWAAIYETDAPLWLLGVIGKALRTGQIDSSAFGGPATTTHQGSLIEAVQEKLEGTPLSGVLQEAFDRDLRNALAHNSFEILIDGSKITVSDERSGRTWTGQQAWDLIVAGQQLLQSVLVAIQVAKVSRVESDLASSGVVSATYTQTPAGMPIIVLGQLWCCRDLDPQGLWLDVADLRLQRSDSFDELLAGSTTLAGGSPLAPEIVASLESGWVWLVRVPVAPDLGRGLPTIINVEGEALEIVGGTDRHLVPVTVSAHAAQVASGGHDVPGTRN